MIHVGFWYDYGLQYAGGLNYFRNLLFALRQHRPADVKVTLFIGKDLPVDLEQEFSRLADVVKLDLLTRGTAAWFVHRLLYRTLRYQGRVERILRKHRVDVLSHPSMVEKLDSRFRLISWIPDFQYLHLPDLFPDVDPAARTRELRDIHRHSDAVVVSSQDAFKDLSTVLGDAAPARTHVLPFVSQLHVAGQRADDVALLLDKYGLPRRYLFLPNQFWAHKNHRVAFDAVLQLRRQGTDVTLVCTGWMKDPNNAPASTKASLQLVEDEGLQQHIRLLGSIDYADVLGLLRASVAVVNPSLFEGWSSSVEESKTIGKRAILSDLAVHREQAHPRAVYFDARNVDALAALMKQAWETWPDGVSADDESAAKIELQRRTETFAQRYIQILREVTTRRHDATALR